MSDIKTTPTSVTFDIPLPTAPCDDCIAGKKNPGSLQLHASKELAAFHCEDCQCGAVYFLRQGVWRIHSPITTDQFARSVNAALADSGLEKPGGLN